MFDDIDPRNPIPLYDQIAARIRLAVASGDLAEGNALPSVRQLAARLRINPATVVQAYRALERERGVDAARHFEQLQGRRFLLTAKNADERRRMPAKSPCEFTPRPAARRKAKDYRLEDVIEVFRWSVHRGMIPATEQAGN